MSPEGLNFINYLQEIPYKVREVEYAQVYTNNMRIARVELRETALNEAEIEMAKYHIKNGCPEIVITHNEGNDVPRGLSYEHLRMPVDESDHSADALSYFLQMPAKKMVEFIFDIQKQLEAELSWSDIPEDRLREKLHEEEARENYEMCAEILKYAESKGFDLNKDEND